MRDFLLPDVDAADESDESTDITETEEGSEPGGARRELEEEARASSRTPSPTVAPFLLCPFKR